VNGNQPRLRPYEKPPEFVARYEYDLPGRRLLRYDEIRESMEEYIPAHPPLPTAPKLVSSIDGAISCLLFTVPSFVLAQNDYWDVYKDLFIKVPNTAELIVLAHESIAPEVEDWMSSNGLGHRTKVVVPEGGWKDISFTIWAEDAYLFVRDSDGSGYFVEPCEFRRMGDSFVANVVAKGTSLNTYDAPLYFQGGNILVADDFFLIGEDYIEKTFESEVLEFPEGDEERKQKLRSHFREYVDHDRTLKIVGSRLPVPEEKELEYTYDGVKWKECVYQGNEAGTKQPLFHIDMFITLAGRSADGVYTVLVGDPRLAAHILADPVSEYAMTDVFDDIAAQLTDEGFNVIRNPLPLVYVDEKTEWGQLRSWYFATSNNALVEVTADEKRVWLPSYGHEPWGHDPLWPPLQKTDQANRRIWENLGFEVIMLGNFHPFVEGLGAVHCIKKYLSRGP
jgi:hypothetical protein